MLGRVGALITVVNQGGTPEMAASALAPFEGRYRDYARRNGIMIPMSAEVAWLLPEGRFAYWRGHPAEVRYDGRRY